MDLLKSSWVSQLGQVQGDWGNLNYLFYWMRSIGENDKNTWHTLSLEGLHMRNFNVS